jgi:L-iditol 2-dehydrogenase
MLEPLAVGIYAEELAAIRPGDTVAILGAGAIGLSVLQPAKLAGAGKILVSDPIAARRELAKGLGADVVCAPEDIRTAAGELTHERGFDVVFECAGQPESIRETSLLARVLGRVMIVGIPRGDDYTFDASAARRRQLTVTFVRRSNLTAERAIELAANGEVDVLGYVTHVFPLEKVGEAMELAESRSDGVLRAVIRV